MVFRETLAILADAFVGISAVLAYINIKKYKENKSYDLLTEKRLKNYDCILNTYQKLLAVSSPEYIDKISISDRNSYIVEYFTELKKLNGYLSTTEQQEYYLLKEYDALFEMVENYVNGTQTKEELNKQLNLIMIFTDIYLWALWRYIQELHKLKSVKEYSDKFDMFFSDYYYKSKSLNARRTDFFEKYPLDIFITHCPKRFHCIFCSYYFKHH